MTAVETALLAMCGRVGFDSSLACVADAVVVVCVGCEPIHGVAACALARDACVGELDSRCFVVYFPCWLLVWFGCFWSFWSQVFLDGEFAGCACELVVVGVAMCAVGLGAEFGGSESDGVEGLDAND